MATSVLIVGGGVIGCALAHYLTKSGAHVTLLERRRIGQEASWATAGIITAPLAPTIPIARARLELASAERYHTLVEELREATGISVEYNPTGELLVALTDAEAEALHEAIPWQRNLGLPVEWIDGDAARHREPALSPEVRGAIWCPIVASLRGHRLTLALARAAQVGGATIIEETPAEGLLTENGRVVGVRTRAGDFRADATVIAAGAWSGALGEAIGLNVPTRPVKGQMLALADATPPLRHIIAGGGGYLLPRADGTIAVAATVDTPGFDIRVTPEGLAWLSNLVRTVAPALSGARVVDTWAGLRPDSPDGAPVIGRAPGHDNLWIATGHFRNGILWAPITAELLTESILTNTTAPDLIPYDPARFSDVRG
jgi:glycine oxidase